MLGALCNAAIHYTTVPNTYLQTYFRWDLYSVESVDMHALYSVESVDMHALYSVESVDMHALYSVESVDMHAL